MIKPIEGGFIASSGGAWIAGVFETEKAAKYAFRFSNKELQKLQDEKNKTTQVITFEDLQKLKNKKNERR